MIFTNKGKMYRLLVEKIPVGTNTSKGTPIKALIEMEQGEEPTVIYSIYRETDAKYVLFITKNGLVKKTGLNEYIGTKKNNGIGAITIKDGDELAAVTLVNEEPIVIVSKKGYIIKFNTTEIGTTSRLTSGIKGINLSADDIVVAALPIRDNKDNLALFTSNGYGKRIELDEIPLQKRGGKGSFGYKNNDTIGFVTCGQLINDEDMLLLIGNKNSICVKATEIPKLSKASIGNIVLKNNNILGASKV